MIGMKLGIPVGMLSVLGSKNLHQLRSESRRLALVGTDLALKHLHRSLRGSPGAQH